MAATYERGSGGHIAERLRPVPGSEHEAELEALAADPASGWRRIPDAPAEVEPETPKTEEPAAPVVPEQPITEEPAAQPESPAGESKPEAAPAAKSTAKKGSS
ncbi:hypothetical protein [Kitasatospora sp. P5_F3]